MGGSRFKCAAPPDMGWGGARSKLAIEANSWWKRTQPAISDDPAIRRRFRLFYSAAPSPAAAGQCACTGTIISVRIYFPESHPLDQFRNRKNFRDLRNYPN
jgi:hypothetical protein